MPFGSFLSRRGSRGGSPDTLGVICSPTRLSAAVVRHDGMNRPKLMAYASFTEAPHLGVLSQWLRKQGLQGLPTNLMLPGEDYQILPIEAPNVPPAELAEATRWRIKDMLDFPVEDASVDCLRTPAPDGNGLGNHGWAVVARRERVRHWMAQAKEARLDVRSIDIPELGLRNVLALEGGSNACALLRIGASRGSLIVVWRGELCTFRRFELNAEAFSTGDLQARQHLFERLGLEVQRTADAFERQFYGTVIDRVWVEQSVPEVDLVQQLAPQVTLKVQPFDLSTLLDLDPPSDQGGQQTDQANLIAIGAALRQTFITRDALQKVAA